MASFGSRADTDRLGSAREARAVVAALTARGMRCERTRDGRGWLVEAVSVADDQFAYPIRTYGAARRALARCR